MAWLLWQQHSLSPGDATCGLSASSAGGSFVPSSNGKGTSGHWTLGLLSPGVSQPSSKLSAWRPRLRPWDSPPGHRGPGWIWALLPASSGGRRCHQHPAAWGQPCPGGPILQAQHPIKAHPAPPRHPASSHTHCCRCQSERCALASRSHIPTLGPSSPTPTQCPVQTMQHTATCVQCHG